MRRENTRMILTVATIALVPEVMPLSLTLLYPALHYLAPALHTTNVSWVVSVSLLVGGVSLPLAGKLADLVGKRKVMLLAICAFTLGTVICLFTTSLALFIFGRALQGCVAATIPAAYALMRDVLPSRIVPIAIGVVSTGFGLSAIFGPLISGVLIVSFGYRGVFAFELAYMCLLVPLLLTVVPESLVRVRQRLDIAGALLLTAAATAVMVPVTNAATWGWTSPRTLAFGVAFLLCLGGFLAVENRVAQPIIDPHLLASGKVLMTLVGAGLGVDRPHLPRGGFPRPRPVRRSVPRDRVRRGRHGPPDVAA